MPELENAKMIYSSAFFISSTVEALLIIARHACNKNIPFGFNLSAVFLIEYNLP